MGGPLPDRFATRRDGPKWRVVPDTSDTVPEPPAWLSFDEAEQWRSLWAGPIRRFWSSDLDGPILEDWFRLRRAVAEEPGRVSLHGALRQVEDRLLLSPKARAAARVAVERPAPVEVPEPLPGDDPRLRSL